MRHCKSQINIKCLLLIVVRSKIMCLPIFSMSIIFRLHHIKKLSLSIVLMRTTMCICLRYFPIFMSYSTAYNLKTSKIYCTSVINIVGSIVFFYEKNFCLLVCLFSFDPGRNRNYDVDYSTSVTHYTQNYSIYYGTSIKR